MLYDLIIIGGGPAAITAAIYAARKKIKVLLVTKEFGGQMMEGHQVDNYLGLPGILGMDLTQKFVEHLKKFEKDKSHGAYDLEIKEGETVKAVVGKQSAEGGKKTEDGIVQFEVHTDERIYETKTVIVATGKMERKLDIPGAKEFEGKGISYCSTCDTPLFRDKIVAVIGAGDAGQDSVWQLTKYASKVYLLNRYDEMRGDNKDIREKIEKDPGVEILNEVEPTRIAGEKFVSALFYRNFRTKEEKKIEVDGIFVEIGSTPSSALVRGLLRCNDKEEIIVDHNSCATSVPGIFAAGDVTDVSEKQIIIAAGMGAKAALGAYEYLKNR